MKTELGITLPEPEVSPAEIEMLVRVLFNWETAQTPAAEGKRAREPGWLTAKEIANRLGMRETESDEPTDSSERHVRKIASAAAPVVVSYPGSPGYKLWNLCTVAEINHCIEAIESQAKDMLKRAVLYRQAYHKRFRGVSTVMPQPSLL